MKRKLTAFLLTLCLLLTLSSFAMAENNPVTVVESYKELTEEIGDIKLNDVPEDAEDAEYLWIDSEPVIAQISFEYDGYDYIYRAALNPDDPEAEGADTGDISGVYEELDKTVTVNMNDENVSGGSYALRYDETSGQGVANWVSEITGCRYSLYAEDGCRGKIKRMPIVELMDEMFLCLQDTESVEAIVASTSKKALAVNLPDGSSAVLDCSGMAKNSVSAGDMIQLLYYGDLDGESYAVKIEKLGATDKKDGQQFSGLVFRYLDNNSLFVRTDDNNVFLFLVNSDTKVEGKASSIAENQEVTVSYTGDLYDNPVALNVNVTKVGVPPTPTPTAQYTEGTKSGYITASAGDYITVGGICFRRDPNCVIYGVAQTSDYATIRYRYYGGSDYVAMVINFSNGGKSEYQSMSAYGTVYGYGNGSINVDGVSYSVSNATAVRGTYYYGCQASVDFDLYKDGTRKATQIAFIGASEYEMCSGYGTAYGYTGGSINVDGVNYTITASTVIEGSYSYGIGADLRYNLYRDGRREATQIRFDNVPSYVPKSTYGTVYGYDGASVNIDGQRYVFAPGAVVNGYFVAGATTASVNYNHWQDGTLEVTYIQFYSNAVPDPAPVWEEPAIMPGMYLGDLEG
ncbi:MAG: hypothetical protein Q4E35_00765 [Eubacteriales bacterium]|nr:hypothetical protein [Eubacteriales bacterium]